jgi:hypothetical protein
MSKKAKHEGIFKDRQKHKDDKRYVCPFPNCVRIFWREEGKPDCCPLHRQMIQDVGFIIAHLKPVPKQSVEEQRPTPPVDTAAKPKIVVVGGVSQEAGKLITEAAASLEQDLKVVERPKGNWL